MKHTSALPHCIRKKQYKAVIHYATSPGKTRKTVMQTSTHSFDSFVYMAETAACFVNPDKWDVIHLYTRDF